MVGKFYFMPQNVLQATLMNVQEFSLISTLCGCELHYQIIVSFTHNWLVDLTLRAVFYIIIKSGFLYIHIRYTVRPGAV